MWIRLKELIIEQHPKLETISRNRQAFVTLGEAAKEA